MNREHWIAAKALFATVADLSDGDAERKLLLAGDPLVAAQVRKLLAADREVKRRGFLDELDTPPPPNLLGDADDSICVQDTPVSRDRRVGMRLGVYRLTEFIAQGGMGAVYKAVRDEHYDQVVAVKILKDSLDSPQLVARFHRERQSMAKLLHPGIARLYNGGSTDDGLPFLVMEYVDGPRLLRHCKERGLPNREKMELYRRIVEAIAYAHSQGILHRDLKPSNILVRRDGTPVVTDFGLARPLEASDFSTQTAAIMGTPSYMSPEQVSGGDTTSVQVDVYGLGAILYELLTGRPPFQAAIPLETMRLVRNTAPTPPRSIDSLIHRDLETICLKCLEKEPTKRFRSANDLLAEVDRWLSGRPIQSRPIGVVGRFARWAKRNPALAAVATGSAALLAGALITVTAFWQSARADKTRAERNLTTAREAIQTLVRQTEALRLQPGQEQIRRDNLQTALAFNEKIAADYPDDESALDELARANYRLAQLLSQGHSQLEAAKHFRKAISGWERLQAKFPEKPEYPYELYRAYWLLACLPSAGLPSSECTTLLLEAFRILEDLTGRFPDDPRYWDSLSALCPTIAGIFSESHPATSIAYLERGVDVAMKLDREFPEGSRYIGNAASNLLSLAVTNAHRKGDLRTALAQLQKALDVSFELLRRFPNDPDVQCSVAMAKVMLAEYLAMTADVQRAERLYREALALFDVDAANSPSLAAFQIRSCNTRMQLANLFAENGQEPLARDMYQQARQRLSNALALNSGHIQLPYLFARHLLECPLVEFRDTAKAAQMVDRVKAFTPSGEEETWELRGKLHYRRGEYEAALAAMMSNPLCLNEESMDARFIIAMSLSKLGRTKDAAKAFLAAREASAIHQQIGNWKSVWQKEAEAIFRKASVSGRPNSTATPIH